MRSGAAEPLVFVTVGTERYPFRRLVDWVDAWAQSDRGRAARCFIQYGAGVPPRAAEGADFLPFATMQELLGDATAVVCHAGTGSVMLARALGRKPIVVPRVKSYGENVDDHQVDFARRLQTLGEAEMAESFEQLTGLLDGAAAGERSFRVTATDGHVAEAVRRFEAAVERLGSAVAGAGAPRRRA
jgi:UDP-N-acetylglucosamine transferase subunit ALG13